MNNYMWSGERIRLRPILTSDWEKFHQNDFDSEGARLCDVIYFPRSEEGTKTWASRIESGYVSGDSVTLAIETFDNELVGSINTNSCDTRHGTFKYGVAIFRDHWRKGYASDAVRIILRYYFDELRYQKINSHIYSFNTNSIALQEHLGFTLEGKLRNMIFTNGQHYDEYVYGLTKCEYEKR